MPEISIGRTVHYVLDEGYGAGEHRPAVVVRDWGDGMVNLLVFLDGANDTGKSDGPLTKWVTSAQHDEGGAGHTWHWPEGTLPHVQALL